MGAAAPVSLASLHAPQHSSAVQAYGPTCFATAHTRTAAHARTKRTNNAHEGAAAPVSPGFLSPRSTASECRLTAQPRAHAARPSQNNASARRPLG